MKNFCETAWRRRNLVLGITLLCLLFGFSASALRQNIYVAHAYMAPRGDYETALKAANLVKRTQMLEGLVVAHDLLSLPEYNPTLVPDNSLIGAWSQKVKAEFDPVHDQADLEARALKHLDKNFTIIADGNMIEFQVQSSSPWKSMEVVNTLLQKYQSRMTGFEFLTVQQANASSPNPSQIVVKNAEKPEFQRPPLLNVLLISLGTGLLLGVIAALQADRIYYRKKLCPQ